MAHKNDSYENDDKFNEGYRKAVDDIIYSILSYVPKSDDYKQKIVMRRCRDDIATKISTVIKSRKQN